MGFIKNIKEEITIIKERDPAIHSSMEVFLYPSFKVMVHYRMAHKLYQKKHYFLATASGYVILTTYLLLILMPLENKVIRTCLD